MYLFDWFGAKRDWPNPSQHKLVLFLKSGMFSLNEWNEFNEVCSTSSPPQLQLLDSCQFEQMFLNLCTGVGVNQKPWACSKELYVHRLPAVSGFGFQPALRRARTPCLGAFPGFSQSCFSNSSPRLSRPLCSGSSPRGISAKQTRKRHLTAELVLLHGSWQRRSVPRHWFVTCRPRFADIRELFIWSKLSMAAVLVFTSDSRLILWELASCRNTCVLTFMLSFKGGSLKRELCFYIINYPDFPWELLHRLLHSSKLAIHPFSDFFQGVSHLFTETVRMLTQKRQHPWRYDVKLKHWAFV